MARLPRLALAGHLHLLIQRGQHGQPVFRDADDFVAYLDNLRESARSHGVAVHGYALVESEVLLLATPSDARALSAMMQSVSRRFVPGYNRRHARHGALWEGRFASTVVEPATHGLACLRLVELAPVDAGIVSNATDHRWSSAGHHAGQLASTLVSEHLVFWQLGNTPFEREARWRQLLVQPMPPQERNLLRRAALHGWALGSPAFQTSWAKAAGRRLSPLSPGRPAKLPAANRSVDLAPIDSNG